MKLKSLILISIISSLILCLGGLAVHFSILKLGSPLQTQLLLIEFVENVPTPNYRIAIASNEKSIKVYSDTSETSAISTLTTGDKVNVSNYDKNSEYTKISFLDADRKLVQGYIQTIHLKQPGLSTGAVVGVVLASVSVVILISLTVIAVQYKKKQDNQILE